MLAKKPIDKSNVFLYHKTTRRDVYDDALDSAPSGADVLLWNADGYITETSIANVAVNIKGVLCTPPVECGLLNGTYRDWLVRNGMIEERPIHLDQLTDGMMLTLFNSVRTQYPARLSVADLSPLAEAELA